MQITIAGVTVPVIHGTVNITRQVGQRSTGGFLVEDGAGSLRFYQGQPVVVTDNKGNSAFKGVVLTDDRTRATAGALLEHDIKIADNHYFADKRLAPYSAVNRLLGDIARDLITQFLSSEGITAGRIDDGPLVVSLVSNYAPCSAVLDSLAQKAGSGWYWLINDDKTLDICQQTTAPTAPYTIDDTLIEWGTDVATHNGDQYRNTQYMLGGVQETALQTETRKGDGVTTAFTWNYPLNSTPTLTLNGAAQTVGILGVDTGKNWYWQEGSQVTTQDSGGVKLLATDTLQNVYIGQFPAVAISSDDTAIATQQSREGGGSTGIVEAAAFDTTLTSADQAFQAGAGLLSQFAHDAESFEGVTSAYGFAEGQVVTVNVPAQGYVNAQMLIESVTITDVGPIGAEVVDLYYDLKAVQGPIAAGWQAYFKQLAGQAAQVIGAITLGQSSTLTLIEPVNEAWGWSESVAETVTVCPFPGASLYPSASLFAC